MNARMVLLTLASTFFNAVAGVFGGAAIGSFVNAVQRATSFEGSAAYGVAVFAFLGLLLGGGVGIVLPSVFLRKPAGEHRRITFSGGALAMLTLPQLFAILMHALEFGLSNGFGFHSTVQREQLGEALSLAGGGIGVAVSFWGPLILQRSICQRRRSSHV